MKKGQKRGSLSVAESKKMYEHYGHDTSFMKRPIRKGESKNKKRGGKHDKTK